MKKLLIILIPIFVMLFKNVSYASNISSEDIRNLFERNGINYSESVINNFEPLIRSINDGNNDFGFLLGQDRIRIGFLSPASNEYEFTSIGNQNGFALNNSFSYYTYSADYNFNFNTMTIGSLINAFSGNYGLAIDQNVSMYDYTGNEVEIEYEYDSNIGYLVGIKERAKILVVENNDIVNSGASRIFKFGWSSKTSTGLDVKYGMFLDQQQGDDHYGDDSFYRPLQIQAKLFFRAKVFNTFTGKLKRDVSDPSLSWHEFDLFDAFDPYSFQFGFADFYLWFDELMDSINASLFEKYTTYGDLYLRLVGSYYDDNLDEIFVCGPWVKISFSVLSGDGAIIDDVYVVGGQSVSEEGVLSIDSSSPYKEGELSHAEVGTGTSVSEAENNVIHVNGQGVVTSLSGLFDQISDIPPLIGKIFSFLPSWCLELFATAFGLCVVVLVWKVASG